MSRWSRVVLAFFTLAIPVAAQNDTTPIAPKPAPETTRAKVPFNVGERAEYNLKYGVFHAGTSVLEVLGIDSVRGQEAWHTVFTVKGGVIGYRINDKFESWMHTHSLASLRIRQDQREGRYERERELEIFPERKEYTENGGDPKPTVEAPLDDGSFVFFLRTIPLEVGQDTSFDRYYIPDRNPVRIQVLRRERISVPAGTFNTIVIRPIIKARGVFSEGGRAEVWLTDDSLRLVVQIKSRMKVGSLSLYLKNYRPATTPLKPDTTQVSR
jgi:hypothetical protein